MSAVIPSRNRTDTSTVRAFGSRARALGLKVLNLSGALVVLVGLWQWAASGASSVFFPAPLDIAKQAHRMFLTGPASELYMTRAVTVDISQTLWRLLLGFAIGSLVGVVIGIAVGRSRSTREFADPIIEFLRSVPATATLPLFIILLGGDDAMRVAFIAYGVSWFVLINTAAGVSAIHATPLALGQVFRMPAWKVLLRIILPAASPKIFAGLRISLTGALLLAVVSEFMLATNGIGYQLIQSQTRFAIKDMWAWMLVLALLGFALNAVLEAVEHRFLAWDKLARTRG